MIFPYLFHFGGIFYEDLCSCPSAREKGSSEGRAGRGVQVQFNRGGRGEATENEVGDLSALEKRPEKGEK